MTFHIAYLVFLGKLIAGPGVKKSPAKSSSGVLCSSDIKKPGQQVGKDHIVSAQPIIVPQEKDSMK